MFFEVFLVEGGVIFILEREKFIFKSYFVIEEDLVEENGGEGIKSYKSGIYGLFFFDNGGVEDDEIWYVL